MTNRYFPTSEHSSQINKNKDEPHVLGYGHAEEDKDCAQQPDDWCTCGNAMLVRRAVQPWPGP